MRKSNTTVRKPPAAKSKDAAPLNGPTTNAVSVITCDREIEAAIRVRAYHKWEAAGRPPGDGVNFWLEAEREVLHLQ